MPRDSAGNYQLPSGNPVEAGTLIESNWANVTMADLGAEFTDSLSRNGKGGMLAPLRAIDGTSSLPGYAFGPSPNTGMYRNGSGDLVFMVAGVEALRLKNDPLKNVQDPIVGAVLTIGTPVGTTSPPAGYLPCDSSTRNPTAYPALFAVLGTSWGGDGVSTFQLPPPDADFDTFVFAGV